jgi:DNA-binding IclR family transcriptional regulator
MGTVAKALSLLNHFSRIHPQIGLSDFARLSGLNKATTYRLLTELQAEGFVEQVGSGREYRLGPAFLRFAALREAAVPMRDLAGTVLQALSDATQETAHLSLMQGVKLTMLSFAYSTRHGTRVTMEDAQVLALHATSSGLAVLAFSPPEFVEHVLSQPLEKRTEDTMTDPEAIRAVLANVRRTGIAESVGGFEKDVHSHAMPLFDAQTRVIGAMAVAAPVARITPALKSLVRSELRMKALELTRAMGGFPPDGIVDGDEAAE